MTITSSIMQSMNTNNANALLQLIDFAKSNTENIDNMMYTLDANNVIDGRFAFIKTISEKIIDSNGFCILDHNQTSKPIDLQKISENTFPIFDFRTDEWRYIPYDVNKVLLDAAEIEMFETAIDKRYDSTLHELNDDGSAINSEELLNFLLESRNATKDVTISKLYQQYVSYIDGFLLKIANKKLIVEQPMSIFEFINNTNSK